MEVLELIIAGLCTGIGSAIGNYLANRGFIKYMEKVNLNGIKQNKQVCIPPVSESK